MQNAWLSDDIMFENVKKFFTTINAEDTQGVDQTLRPEIALCVLLLETAYADGECSAQEKEQLAATLRTLYALSPEAMGELIATSNVQRQESVDLFRFTRYMNETLTKEEKLTVMRAVWRIILVDGHLEAHEDHFAHKLANLLRLTHKELIDCKLAARTQFGKR